MKKLALIFLISCISIALGYTKTVTTEDGFLSFEVPEECGCIDIFHRNPRKLEIKGSEVIFDSKYLVCFSEKFSDFLVKKEYRYERKEFEEYLLHNNFPESDQFAFDQFYNRYSRDESKQYVGFLPKSYKPIIMDKILGEEYMYAPLDSKVLNKYGGGSMNYKMTFVLSDRLERISFGRIIIDGSSLVNSFPQWFEMRKDGNYYWINQACLEAMYDLLFSDDYKKLPRDLQLIRETRDMILQTVKINNPPVDTSKLEEGVITY